MVEAEPNFQELVRYIHLHPLRTGVVLDLRTLARYLRAGHSALLWAAPRPWQNTPTIRGRFGPTPARARMV